MTISGSKRGKIVMPERGWNAWNTVPMGKRKILRNNGSPKIPLLCDVTRTHYGQNDVEGMEESQINRMTSTRVYVRKISGIVLQNQNQNLK